MLASWALPRGVPGTPTATGSRSTRRTTRSSTSTSPATSPRASTAAGGWGSGTAARTRPRSGSAGKIVLRFDGERVSGRYALFHTRGKDWMIHRMDPAEPGEPLPERLAPMLATPGRMPRDAEHWGFEIDWRGRRAIALCDTGHLTLLDAAGKDLRPLFVELGEITLGLAGEPVALDGVVAVLGEDGAPSPELLERRLGASTDSEIRRRRRNEPATLIVFDLLHQGRESLLDCPTRSAASGSRRSSSTARRGAPPPITRGRARHFARPLAARVSTGSSPSASTPPTPRANVAATGAQCRSRSARATCAGSSRRCRSRARPPARGRPPRR